MSRIAELNIYERVVFSAIALPLEDRRVSKGNHRPLYCTKRSTHLHVVFLQILQRMIKDIKVVRCLDFGDRHPQEVVIHT